jgi:D-3-phosphoglycerate dehydrogenase
MPPPLVLVTAPTVSETAQKILRDAGGEIDFMSGKVTEDALTEAFAKRPYNAIVLRSSPPVTARVLDAAKSLKIISKHGAGVDSIDIPAATARGISVMMANGANAGAVAEHSLALMLCIVRELPRYHAKLQNGVWKDLSYIVTDFRHRVVGIVGYGQIGRRTARLASAFGTKVIVHSRSRPDLPEGMEWDAALDGLLRRADIVSLHCPLTEKTRGLIGKRELALMPRGSIVINTSRGPVVDEAALIEALESGHLGGAGLDTFAKEPPDRTNPLFHRDNVICTPHIAVSTIDASLQMGTIAANNILSWLRGEIYDAANVVNPEVKPAIA